MKTAHAAIVLLLFAHTLVACEDTRIPFSDSSSATIQTDARTDSIYVDGIGFMTKADLYERFMNRKYGRGRRAYRYAKAILKTGDTGAVDSLIAFIDRYPGARYYTVKALTEERVSELGPWLRQNADELDVAFWSEIGGTLAHSGWRDSVVVDVLMDHALNARPSVERALAAGVFPAIGTKEEVRILAAAADTVGSADVYWAMMAGLSRFDTLAFNQRLRQALEDADHLPYYVAEGLRMHNRYDFLPELRALEDRSMKRLRELRALRKNEGEDEIEITYARENDPEEIAKLISYLEVKRADGAPIGVPLDYPNSTRDDATAQ